jgi:lipoprotein Spr
LDQKVSKCDNFWHRSSRNFVIDTTNRKIAISENSKGSDDIERIPVLLIKYAIAIDTTVESLSNYALYAFIDEWMGTKYQYGGNSRLGIDCSSFSNTLFQTIYGLSLPRTSSDQFLFANPVSEEKLQEGDLLFFKTGGVAISHVGVYLGNGRFVHASTVKGVTIDFLEFPYYKKTFFSAGRISPAPEKDTEE